MRPATLSLLLLATACTRPASQPVPHASEWSYEGASGPAHWGALSPDFAPCEQGRQQSPIDLAGASGTHSPGYRIHYAAIRPTLLNNGHTIQVNYPAGSSLRVGDEWLELLQYHFHAPRDRKSVV